MFYDLSPALQISSVSMVSAVAAVSSVTQAVDFFIKVSASFVIAIAYLANGKGKVKSNDQNGRNERNESNERSGVSAEGAEVS